jgi:pimeloyl-ACP methyl ester carboxylesterase
MGATSLDARIRLAEHRLAADGGVLVEEFSVPLPGTGGAVRVLATGEGQPYLLLHGDALSAAWWIPLMPHLTGRLVAVDLPGHGLSDACDPRAGTLRTVAVGLVTAVLDIERLEQAVLVGHSLGGAAALWSALDAPGRVSRIVLISDAGPALAGLPGDAGPALPDNPADPPPGPVPPATGALSAVPGPPDGYAAALAHRLREPALLRMPGLAEAAYYCAHRQRLGAAVPPVRRQAPQHRRSGSQLAVNADDLCRIDVPVWCLRGRDDVVHPIEPVRAAVAGMPRAGLQFVAGGHAPWLGDPAPVGALITTAARVGDRPATPPRTRQPVTRAT